METAIALILFFLMVASFIWTLCNIFVILRIKSRLLGKRELRKEAQRQVQQLKLKDPVITCDYCGCKIDTRKDKVCPGCGGSYNTDKEWQKRHEVNEEYIDKNAVRISGELETKNRIESGPAIKRLIISGSLTFVIILMFCIAGRAVARYPKIRGDEELNEPGSYKTFTESDYKIKGDGVVYEDDDITVKILGFYDDGKTYDGSLFGPTGNVKVGFLISNRSKEDLRVSLRCDSLDGITREGSYFYIYSTFKKQKDTVIYEEMYTVPDQTVSEMIITHLQVRYDDYTKDISISDPVVISTTASVNDPLALAKTETLFENDLIGIYKHSGEDPEMGRSNLIIKNKTDMSLSIECDGVTADGIPVDYPYSFYDSLIPPAYTFIVNAAHAYNKTSGDIADKKVQVSFTFRFKEDPAKSFSTGYFDM